jgi:hypothetical protein
MTTNGGGSRAAGEASAHRRPTSDQVVIDPGSRVVRQTDTEVVLRHPERRGRPLCWDDADGNRDLQAAVPDTFAYGTAAVQAHFADQPTPSLLPEA